MARAALGSRYPSFLLFFIEHTDVLQHVYSAGEVGFPRWPSAVTKFTPGFVEPVGGGLLQCFGHGWDTSHGPTRIITTMATPNPSQRQRSYAVMGGPPASTSRR